MNTIELLRSGQSMVDMSDLMKEPYGHIIYELTLGVPSVMWGWNEHVWLAIEAALYDSPPQTLVDMLRMLLHDVDDTAAEGFALLLRDWYGKP
jgi:hypothetical protein